MADMIYRGIPHRMETKKGGSRMYLRYRGITQAAREDFFGPNPPRHSGLFRKRPF